MKDKMIFSILFQFRSCFTWFLRTLFVFLFVLVFFYFTQENFAFALEKNVPIVTLTSNIDSETTNDSLFIGGRITHQYGVRGYRIYNNYRVIISRESPPNPSLRFAQEIPLREGLNKIEIIPFDHTGNLSTERKVVQINYKKGTAVLWAVIVGVGEYESSDVTPCQFCFQDAKTFADLMEEWAPENLKFYTLKPIRILGKQATRSNIRQKLVDLSRQAGPDDIIVFYFAGLSSTISEGHGLSGVSHYLLPYDVKPTWEDLPFTAISVPELAHILEMGRVKAYAVLDTSFSYRKEETLSRSLHIQQSLTNVDRENIRIKLSANQWIEELSSSGKIQVIASSRGLDGAYESLQDKHGFFTLYLLDIFKGKGDMNRDGQITLEEAFHYIYPKVRAATSERQSPIMMSVATESPAIAPGTVAKFQPPNVDVEFELNEHSGVAKIQGQIKSNSGLKGYRIEIGGIPVIHKQLSNEISFSIDEIVFLRPYGDHITVVAEDVHGLETPKSSFLEYFPMDLYSEVFWESFFNENEDDAIRKEGIPSVSRVRSARYDVQKILQDFERMLQNNRIERNRYLHVSSFWTNILKQLNQFLDSNYDDERIIIWNELREFMLALHPKIEILNYNYLQDLWTPEEFLQLNVDIFTKKAADGFTRYGLTVNQVPVILKNITDQSSIIDQSSLIHKFSHQIPLKEGTNQIEVSVINSIGLVMKRTFLVNRQPLRELSACVIGVGQYSKLMSLQFARNNAEDFSNYLLTKTSVLRNHMSTLYDRDATKEKIYDSIKWQSKIRTKDPGIGPLVIYFSGFGFLDKERNTYILPYDADPQGIAQTGIKVIEFIDVIDRVLNPSDALLILDASFIPHFDIFPKGFRVKSVNPEIAYRGRQGIQWKETSEPNRIFEDLLTAPPNWAVLLSTYGEGFELMKEIYGTEFKNSLFTHYLLRYLKDFNFDGVPNENDLLRPAVINLFNLFDRVMEKVRADSNGRQCPQLIDNLRRPFIFQYLPANVYRSQVQSILFKYYLRIGSREWEPGATRKSRQLLLKSLDINYRDSDTYMLLGMLDSYERNFESAEVNFNHSVELAETDAQKAWYHIQWAYSYIRQGKYARGIELLKKGLDLKLDQRTKLIAEIHYGFSLALVRKPSNAQQYLKNIYELILDADPFIQFAFWTRYGDLAFLNRDLDRAIDNYEYAEQFAKQFWVYKKESAYDMAWAFFAQGNYEASDKKAQESFSEDDYLNVLRYFSLSMIGKSDEANKLLANIRDPKQLTWSQNIVAFLLQESDLSLLLEQAGPDPVRQCRAYFYSALQALVEENQTKARQLFLKAISTQIFHIPEWATASVIVNLNLKDSSE
jgi:tetratricopeptide (TPR) repeat protein